MMDDPKKAARLAALKEVIQMLGDMEAEEMMPHQPEAAPAEAEAPQEEMSPEDMELLKAKLAELG